MHDETLSGKPIRDLRLAIDGTPLAPILARFQGEFIEAGLTRVKPRFYLSTEWGVPFETVALAIPFFLARPDLADFHLQRTGHIEGTDAEDILRYLRHELGHVVNYAYRLYDEPEWVQLFGAITQPYRDQYSPEPFSRRFVWHLPGWYAQKHPDEDFAETFAVWLTPRSPWRRQYKGWPAMRKLRYVERVARAVADVEPIVNTGEVDITPEDIGVTVEQFYRQAEQERQARIDIELDAHLGKIFLARRPKESKPAADIIRKYTPALVDNIAYWTGVRRPIVRALIDSVCRTCERMKLWGVVGEEARYIVEVTTLATTLAMNYLLRGRFD